MKTLPAKISISRVRVAGEDRIILRVQDGNSRLHVLEVSMSPEDFARAVTGLSEQDAVATWRGLDKVGLRHEIKHVEVPYKSPLGPHEVDGWVADRSQYGNHHRRRGPAVEVTYHRYVQHVEAEA